MIFHYVLAKIMFVRFHHNANRLMFVVRISLFRMYIMKLTPDTVHIMGLNI